ncbi:MAG: universal stress protein [Acidimicrobiia bacterium]|nr:universal stress protein [Acidimicrobiia bacterium]MBT8192091.1 universal stress protein [Acidimicrobiia bacterium]NNF87609.1 universal stress protein [Acidimicrobiia bacterium]NNL14054.1 universal stress protein [Acidimicrobiia bacterium]NNL97942.1 universal stress protein [Acidimicrobiia bacterium]
MATIVVGYTDTLEGEAALARAMDEAKLRGAHLEVVHSHKEGRGIDADEILHYNEVMANIDRRLDEAEIDHATHDYIQGQAPAEDIVACARITGAELIVIGLRNRTKTGKYLMGSVAQDVMLNAPCSVLAVRPADVPA